jgi:DNA-binding NarL/FixJ family response regulator
MASLIPGSEFVALESQNHVILEDEPAWTELRNALRRFLPVLECTESPDQEVRLADLTEREHEILELIAQGLGNNDIARRLALSPKTVRNHVSNVFGKLGATTRAQAIVTAREAGIGIRHAAL